MRECHTSVQWLLPHIAVYLSTAVMYCVNRPFWPSKFIFCTFLSSWLHRPSLSSWNMAISFPPKDLCIYCSFLLGSRFFAFLMPDFLNLTHLSSNLSSSERPSLASPYRNDLPQVFAILAFMTLHIPTLFLRCFFFLLFFLRFLQYFPAG